MQNPSKSIERIRRSHIQNQRRNLSTAFSFRQKSTVRELDKTTMGYITRQLLDTRKITEIRSRFCQKALSGSTTSIILFSKINGEAILVWDGIDFPIQKSRNFQTQKSSYSVKSSVNAVRFMHITAMNGDSVVSIGPFYVTGSENDESMYPRFYKTSQNQVR